MPKTSVRLAGTANHGLYQKTGKTDQDTSCFVAVRGICAILTGDNHLY